MKIQSKVSRGAQKGTTLFPHLHSDGTYVVSMSRFQKDYVRVGTFEEIANYLPKGFSVRMSNAGEGVASASLISPNSITVLR